MADFRKPVLLFDLALNFLHRTRIDHDSHPSALSADDMVVMALRVNQLVVAAGTVLVYFLVDLQALQERHHPKYRRIIWCFSADFGSRLNFVERKRFLRSKQRVKNLEAILGNPHTVRSQELDNRIHGQLFQWRLVRVRVPSHELLELTLRGRRIQVSPGSQRDRDSSPLAKERCSTAVVSRAANCSW